MYSADTTVVATSISPPSLSSYLTSRTLNKHISILTPLLALRPERRYQRRDLLQFLQDDFRKDRARLIYLSEISRTEQRCQIPRPSEK